MKQNGVTDVVWLPDSETNWLYLLMQAEPSLRLVGVSREGHAFSLAAGLSTGGRKPLIMIQNTGMMESGDSIRGWLLGLNVPVVMLVGYRGWTRHGDDRHRGDLHRALLMAFGITYYLVEGAADAPRITVAFEEAARTNGRLPCWSATSTTASTGSAAATMFRIADVLRIFRPPRRCHRRPRPRRAPLGQDLQRPTRDVPVGDPAMGGHASFALGLALARPERR